MRKKMSAWRGSLAGAAVCTLSTLALLGGNAAYAANAYSQQPTGVWVYSEDPNYTYAKGSASQMLSIQEAILHHSLSITLKRSLTDQFGFKVGCMVQNPTPLFELDGVGFIQGDLFLQMREGGTLKIGLLQGERDRVRTYEIPLAGFMDYSDRILQSCQNYNQSYNGQQQYLPDYMSKEPSGYAPKQYSLKQPTEEIIDPYAPQPQAQPEPAPQEETPKAPPREVLPFVPGGGPASIGPDGLPVGAQGSSVQGQAGAQVDASLGTASGPMQIGPDGMPITNSASASASAQGANANAAASATSQGPSFDANGNLLPAGQGANGTQPANGQQPNQANPVMDNIF